MKRCLIVLLFAVMAAAGFQAQAGLQGDVNTDGYIDIDDANIIINIMLRKLPTGGAQADRADVNRDGAIDIDDVNLVVNFILHKATPTTDEVDAGVYLGIVGFNQQLYRKEIALLDNRTRPEFDAFIDGLTMNSGTLLYWAADNALSMLQTGPVPKNLAHVVMVTFTDGLDQGSLMMNTGYSTTDQYLAALRSRINGGIKGKALKSYAIGIRGNDVTNNTLFAHNLQQLASPTGWWTEVTDMADVAGKFDGVATMVNHVSKSQDIALRIPGLGNGTKVRFTFDGVLDAQLSQFYIEGTFNLPDRSLRNVRYSGVSSTSGSTIQGVQDGIFVTFKFTDTRIGDEPIELRHVNEWYYVNSTGTWEQNSEFNPSENLDVTVTPNGVLVFLVLDCSSSLGTDFPKLKEAAKAFVRGLTSEVLSPTYTVGGVTFEMVAVDGGTFDMGHSGTSGEADELPVHPVTVGDFAIGRTPVTQALWQAVMGSNPSKFAGDPNRPVDKVSWNDCQTFISKLNALTSQAFRLPTEAEWEYAARGGNKAMATAYAGGNNLNTLGWFGENSDNTTHPVGQKQANELGLYDMSGNVWEWCSDYYSSSYYSISPRENPTGPSSGSYHVRRGGSWDSADTDCRVANRDNYGSTFRKSINGLRLAM